MQGKETKSGKITGKNCARNATVGATAAGAARAALGGTGAVADWTPDVIIQGTNDPALDVPSVQSAVSTQRRILLKGKFNFGDGAASLRQTVMITKGVEIRGETVKSGNDISWRTEISGGGAVLPVPYFGDAANGPFAVNNQGPLQGGDANPVVFEGISFGKWSGEAIFAGACQGLVVRGCRFTEPDEAAVAASTGVGHVAAIFPLGPLCTGSFVAEDNVCVYGEYELPDDEQLLACFLSCFSSISIARNVITGHDDGVEVLYNGLFNQDPAFKATISIKDNNFNLTELLSEKFSIGTAIVCLNNPKSVCEISGNEINAKGPGIAMLLSGDSFTVRNNQSNQTPYDAAPLNPYAFAGLVLGTNIPVPAFFPAEVGPSCNNSVISSNTFAGTNLYGIWTQDVNPNPDQPVLPLNTSHGNVALGNNMANLVSVGATLFLTRGTHDNVFKGNNGTVIDRGTNNLVTGFTPKAGAIDPEVAEAMRRFNEALAAKIGALTRAMKQ